MPLLQARWSKAATAAFVLYMMSLVAYLVIRCIDIARMVKKDENGRPDWGRPDWVQRGYSIAVLVVEVIGVSALVPYAFANMRPTLPEEEESNHDAEQPGTYAEFGHIHNYDVFVMVPCYKESWATIRRTLMCAMFARVPPGCRQHIILCDDGHDVKQNGNCQARAGLVQTLENDMRSQHIDREAWFYTINVSRRPKLRRDASNADMADNRVAGNGKSLNLNHGIKTVIPQILMRYHPDKIQARRGEGQVRLEDIPEDILRNSVVVVLDCDMAICNDPNEIKLDNVPPRSGDGVGFLPKILRVLSDPGLGVDLVLTPQYFTNIQPHADAFNHLNPQFWEYILPGLTTLGYVACTGTNMGLRLSMLHRHSPKSDRVGGEAAAPFAKGQGAASAQYEAAMQGPFPVYSVTEDYALSLELKKAGVKGTYLAEYLVKGAAPHGITAVDTQRGRWTEGHYQIFFSWRNPIFSIHKLGLMGAIYYNYGTLAYLANIITIWAYHLVPLLSAVGLQPVAFSQEFRIAATIYLLLTVAVQYYVREAPHFYGMWRANISNILLSWTYMKAIGRAALRKKSTFQVHACDEKAPATERLMPNPAMAEPQPRSLVQERVPDILGQLAYFSILLLLSLATVLVCVAKIVQDHKVPRTDAPEYSQYLLPIAWAVYNMVGPILFFCAACLKKTRTLEMAMSLLIVVHTMMGLMALATMWFVNSSLTIGSRGSISSQQPPSPVP